MSHRRLLFLIFSALFSGILCIFPKHVIGIEKTLAINISILFWSSAVCSIFLHIITQTLIHRAVKHSYQRLPLNYINRTLSHIASNVTGESHVFMVSKQKTDTFNIKITIFVYMLTAAVIGFLYAFIFIFDFPEEHYYYSGVISLLYMSSLGFMASLGVNLSILSQNKRVRYLYKEIKDCNTRDLTEFMNEYNREWLAASMAGKSALQCKITSVSPVHKWSVPILEYIVTTDQDTLTLYGFEGLIKETDNEIILLTHNNWIHEHATF